MKKILIVEGNLREENQSFTNGGIKTHTESLKDSIAYFTDKIEIDVVNPSSDKNISEKVTDLDKYDGLIWGCLLYTSPSPRDATLSRMPSSA